jgi:hypothetical protein
MSTPSAARIDDGLLHTSIFAEIASAVIEIAISTAVNALAIGLVALAAGVEVCTLGFGTVLAIGIVVGAVMLVTGASAKVHEFAQWAGNKMFPPGIEANISTGSKNVSINSKRAARAAFIMVPVTVEASEPPEPPDMSFIDSMSEILSEMWRPTVASAAPGTTPVDYDRILCKKHPSPILPNVIDTTVAGADMGAGPMAAAAADAPAPGGTDGSAGPLSAFGPTTATTVTTGLGKDVDDISALSPSLQKDLKDLKNEGWKVKYGEAGKGSFARRDPIEPLIILDSNLKSDPKKATQVLAHEVGHAKYPYVADVSSKKAYVNGALADEGAGSVNNIKVQREILATTGGKTDIGISGNSANHKGYNDAYDQYLKDGNNAAANQKMGEVFGKGEQVSRPPYPPYEKYYGDWYDKNYPQKK